HVLAQSGARGDLDVGVLEGEPLCKVDGQVLEVGRPAVFLFAPPRPALLQADDKGHILKAEAGALGLHGPETQASFGWEADHRDRRGLQEPLERLTHALAFIDTRPAEEIRGSDVRRRLPFFEWREVQTSLAAEPCRNTDIRGRVQDVDLAT